MSLNRNRRRWFTTLFVASLVSALAACATGPRDRDRSRQPPPEAVDACVDLSEGDVCSFTGPRNDEIRGICTALRGDEEQLACVPEGGPPGKGGRPGR